MEANEGPGGLLNEMEPGRESSQGMEAVTRGLEAVTGGAEETSNQQRILVEQQMKMNEQMRMSIVMAKGDYIGECPKMMNSQTLESWAEEVKLWDSQSPEPELSSLKYLNFVNNIRESENKELKRFVEIAVMEKRDFVKTEQDSIKNIVDLVIKTLGKSNLESASEAWKEFIEMNQMDGETIRDFVLRFELLEANLRNANLPIPSTALAIQLLMKSNLSSMSKENVLAKVNLDKNEDLHSNVKKTLRELKSLSESNPEKIEKENVIQDAERMEMKSESSPRLETKSGYSKLYERNSKRMEHESRKRDDEHVPDGWNSRTKFNHVHSQRSRHNSSKRDDNLPEGWNFRKKSYHRDLPEEWRVKPKKPVKQMNVVTYTASEYSDVHEESEEKFENDNELKERFTETVYQEGNTDVDPYNAVVDTGCPKTVCGKAFMDAFISSKGKHEQVRRKYEDQNFKFGDGNIYNSNLSHEIEVEIGDLKTTIETSVVDVNIPLLLGMDYLKKWGVVIDTGKEQLHIRKSKESFNIDTKKSNHWKLPIQNGRTMHKQAHRLVLNVELCDLSERELRKHIVKTHKNLAHKSEGHMTKLFQMAGKANTMIRRVIKDVCDSCNICNQFRMTRPRPTIALSKANTSNKVVSLDLKEKRQQNRQILYCVDEFSGYIKAAVLKNKEPETVLKALTRIWVREGPGIPSKGWFSDNGGEFRNSIMMEAATKLGLKIFLTAGNSPWSNGKNERNHYSCDVTVDKLMAEDPMMSLEEALSHATYAHNLQINQKGFSPLQMTFGRQGVIPGIFGGNPASMEPVVESDWFREEMSKRQRAEEIYRKVDSNERLQKLMTQRLTGAADAIYYPGDEVLFKEKDKSKWSGPAKVTNVVGNKVRMIFGGYERTVSSIDVAHFKDEKSIIKTKETDKKAMENQTEAFEDEGGWEPEDNLPHYGGSDRMDAILLIQRQNRT